MILSEPWGEGGASASTLANHLFALTRDLAHQTMLLLPKVGRALCKGMTCNLRCLEPNLNWLFFLKRHELQMEGLLQQPHPLVVSKPSSITPSGKPPLTVPCLLFQKSGPLPKTCQPISPSLSSTSVTAMFLNFSSSPQRHRTLRDNSSRHVNLQPDLWSPVVYSTAPHAGKGLSNP